jgi:hypothetical protein
MNPSSMGGKKLSMITVDKRLKRKAWKNTLRKQKIELVKHTFKKPRVTKQIRVSEEYYPYWKYSAKKNSMTISKFMDLIGRLVFIEKSNVIKKRCTGCNFVNKIEVHFGVSICTRADLKGIEEKSRKNDLLQSFLKDDKSTQIEQTQSG